MGLDQDSSGPISGQFCPPPRGPIEGWLDHITAVGGSLVELDGRRLPRVREPIRKVWATRAAYAGVEVDDDTPTAKLADAVLSLETVKAVEGTAPKRPGSNLRLCLEAAYMERIEKANLAKIGDYLGLARQGDRRNVRRIVARGDELWAALGAWPWALFDSGRLQPGWRHDAVVASELEAWYLRSDAEAASRLRREAARLEHMRRRLRSAG